MNKDLNKEDIIFWSMYVADYNDLELVAKTVYKVYKSQRENKFPEEDLKQKDWHRARQLLEREKRKKQKKVKEKIKQQAKRERALLAKRGVK